MFIARFLVCFAALIVLPVGAEQSGPGLGVKASETMIENWSLDIFADGEGLPAGQGNAVAGKQVYQQYCLLCHGVKGGGGSAEELAGAEHNLIDNPPDKTIGTYWPYPTTIFDFVSRSMPLSAPGSLSNNEIYAVTAYLLYLNDIISETAVINAVSLPQVQMPNRLGFISTFH